MIAKPVIISSTREFIKVNLEEVQKKIEQGTAAEALQLKLLQLGYSLDYMIEECGMVTPGYRGIIGKALIYNKPDFSRAERLKLSSQKPTEKSETSMLNPIMPLG